MSAADTLSTIGAILNIFLFLSQTPLMVNIFKTKDSTTTDHYPSLALLGTTLLWTAYVIATNPIGQLILGNGAGVVISLLYLVIISIYAQSERRKLIFTQTSSLLTVAIVWSAIIYSRQWENDLQNTIGGFVIAIINIVFFISPIPRFYRVFKTGEDLPLPLLLIVVQIFQTIVWCIAGSKTMLNDMFIFSINLIGIIFATLNLGFIILTRYRKSKNPSSTSEVPQDKESIISKQDIDPHSNEFIFPPAEQQTPSSEEAINPTDVAIEVAGSK